MSQGLLIRRTCSRPRHRRQPCRHAFRARRPRGGQAFRRHLGPLGSRRQRGPRKICREWAAKEKVDLTFDPITSNGDKDLLTLMAEGQAKAGHDIMGLRVWYAAAQADNFVPVDDLVDPLIEKYGKVAQARIPRQDQGPLDGGADLLWQRFRAALRPHRLVQGICRDRHAEDVPGRTARQGADGQMDLGLLY